MAGGQRSRPGQPDPDDRRLKQAIRASPVLTRQLKEHWLRVLPHLPAEDKARLWATLRRAAEDLAQDEER